MEFRQAEDVRAVAGPLIEKHHTHLLGVRVECIFLNKTPNSKGREVWGRAKKVSGLPAFLAAGPEDLPEHYDDQPADFFVVEVSEEAWEKLTAKGRRALVDRSLCSCEIEIDEETGSVGLAVVGPDVAEFSAVLERHGAWNEDLEEFVRAGAEQLSLTDVAADPETGEVLAESRS